MAGPRTITITGKERPALFQQLLMSLRANDLDGWRIAIAIDGDRGQEFAEIAQAMLGGLDYSLVANGDVLGIRLNPFNLLSRVFAEGSELNLYLEEDFVVSPDATQLALWYQRHHRLRWACLNLVAGTCGSAGYLSNPAYSDVLFEAHSFNSLGFVIRPAEWFGLFKQVWMGDSKPPGGLAFAGWRTHWGWDWSVYGALADGDFVAVQPALARVTHTGAKGTYSTPAFQERAFGGMAINQQTEVAYRLADVSALPHVLRSHVNLHEESTRRLVELERAARLIPASNDGSVARYFRWLLGPG